MRKINILLLCIGFSLNLFSQSFLTKTMPGKPSLDELDYKSFKAASTPFAGNVTQIKLAEKAIQHASAPSDIILNGEWQLLQADDFETASKSDWSKAIPALVPGSVHTALVNAGKIPDPFFARNDSVAEKYSYMTWWYKKEFLVAGKLNAPILNFDGVAVKCDVWLNGIYLGQHDGMFGGPSFDVSKILKDKNVLLVKMSPAPRLYANGMTSGINIGWRTTVVFNCVYGWHYSKIPSIGIWNNVRISNQAAVEILDPFIATESTDGTMNLQVQLKSVSSNINGTLLISVLPENFKGTEQSFEYKVNTNKSIDTLNFSFKINNPQLWWPNDMGNQNLYRLKISFIPDDKNTHDNYESTFGIRTIHMAPLHGGPYSDKFNWTFVINDKPLFVKGNGWCTMSALMDFSRERYDRFLSLAKMQHIQMMRAWGAGMPETNDFYELCDRYGIMIMQEWPTAWNSHNEQPFNVLKETVQLNTLRIRNHPSLVMYCGGNESDKPFGDAIDMMGKLSVELDGTRPFHRGEPWGGSDHNYKCWWNKEHFDNNLQMTSSFWGEFGIASMPVYESVMRYLPDSEKVQWPPSDNLSLVHHTPVFGIEDDLNRLKQYSGYLMPNDNMRHFITGTQLAQVVAVRHTLERSRTRWPECSGALYYKMNDNYPAASWSSVDWYGAPKPLHYFVQDAFSPVASVILFEHTNMCGKDVSLPVYLLDDNLDLSNLAWKVKIRAYNQKLELIKDTIFTGNGNKKTVDKLGDFLLSSEQTQESPLLLVSEIMPDNQSLFRTFYFMNFEESKGSLFNLRRTSLELNIKGNKAIIKNTGSIPAVGVNVQCPGKADNFTASDNFMWIDAGETKEIDVNITDHLSVGAWNLEGNEYVNLPAFKVPLNFFVDSIPIDFEPTIYPIRYTLDGSTPNKASKLYEKTFYCKESAIIKATAFPDDGKKLSFDSIFVEKKYGLDSKLNKDKSYKPGLKRTEYKGDFKLLSDFSRAEMTGMSVVENILIDTTTNRHLFGYVFEGFIEIEKNGYYKFFLSSDDGSRLEIGNNTIAINDGLHAPVTIEGEIALNKGLFPFKLYYFDNLGGKLLNLEWQGQDFTRRKLDGSILYYQ